MSKGNGKKPLRPTEHDLVLASAIGRAVREELDPRFAAIEAELKDHGRILREQGTILREQGTILREHETILREHGKKLDQIVAGSVGVGRMTKLEERVAALEQRFAASETR